MSGSVIRNPRVEQDLDDLSLYIAQTNLRAALRFLDAAERTFTRLARRPTLGSLWETSNPEYAQLKVWSVQGFENHLVFFRQIDGGIEIIRVLHAARDIESIFEP